MKGHSGAPGIVLRNGKTHIVGIVSRYFKGTQRDENHAASEYYCDAALTTFSDEIRDWVQSIMEEESPHFSRMNINKFLSM
jgi:hypothetical protein